MQNHFWKRALGFGLGGAAGVALVRWQLARLFAESAPYRVERRAGKLEIRRYPATVQAQTTVTGAWATPMAALGEGFRRLATYIFGGNADHDRIAMTTPVIGSTDAPYRMAFVLPHDRDWETLPEPADPRVELRAVPEKRVAALRFRGRFGARAQARRAELLASVRAAGLEPIGDVALVGYDPPTTLPVLRRNEVWIEIA